jgi:hypothetical protein
LNAFKNWLNPKGVRESRLLRELAVWWPELEGGMLKRHAVINGDDEPIKRSRRQTAEGRDGVNGWRVSSLRIATCNAHVVRIDAQREQNEWPPHTPASLMARMHF